MMHQASPGVERAVEAAKAWSERLGAPGIRLVDYVLGLLDEEEGRPAVLLERFGLDVSQAREALTALPSSAPLASPLPTLFHAARNWSLAHHADPVFMTDAFLLAVLQADPEFWQTVPQFEDLAGRIAATFAEVSPMAGTNEPPVAFELAEVTEDLSAARVLDANLNRCREALRVIEDYCRFVLEDRFLTGQVKETRHAVAAITTRLPAGLLLAGRETLHDVGTGVTATGEYERSSLRDVAAVNLKRLQESLRSLEEYGKLFGAELGRDLETLRYRAYTLERAIAVVASARDKLKDARLYALLTGSQCKGSLDWVIEQAAAGGVNIFQLREKELPDRELIEHAQNFRRWTRKAHALFIMNDRPDIARLVEADGVHLGQDDLPVQAARRIVGPESLIGVSTHSIDQVRQAVLDGADYLGIGPTFPSKTKSFEAFPGLEFVRAATAETTLPMFALGGIGPSNIGEVVAAGGTHIAVSSCLAGAKDPEAVARILRRALDG